VPVHLKDIHLEKGMHCVDCHFRQDAHGNGVLYNEPRAAIEIDCIDCHGTIKEPAKLTASGPAAGLNLVEPADGQSVKDGNYVKEGAQLRPRHQDALHAHERRTQGRDPRLRAHQSDRDRPDSTGKTRPPPRGRHRAELYGRAGKVVARQADRLHRDADQGARSRLQLALGLRQDRPHRREQSRRSGATCPPTKTKLAHKNRR
jgi:hypothetical protein